VKRGKKPGVGKVLGEFDLTRLLEGDAVADLTPEDQNRLRVLKATLSGSVLQSMKRKCIAKIPKDKTGLELASLQFRNSAVDVVFWCLEELRAAARKEQNPARIEKLIRGLVEVDNVHAERQLPMAVHIAMTQNGNPAERRIYATQAQLRKWLHEYFPGWTGSKSDKGRSQLLQRLQQWNITCQPR